MNVSTKGNKKTGRADMVYSALKKQILNLSIEPGQPLTEEALATSLDVSRTPIREALRMLERDRLVESTLNKGVIVRGISAKDVSEIFELRKVLESWAAGEAAKVISDENLKAIEQRLNEAKNKLQGGEGDAASHIGDEIHDIIAFVVNNRWFSRFSNELSSFTIAYKTLASSQEGQLAKAQAEHEAIYGALKEHDSAKASALMAKHIAHSLDAILKALNNRPYSSSSFDL